MSDSDDARPTADTEATAPSFWYAVRFLLWSALIGWYIYCGLTHFHIREVWDGGVASGDTLVKLVLSLGLCLALDRMLPPS